MYICICLDALARVSYRDKSTKRFFSGEFEKEKKNKIKISDKLLHSYSDFKKRRRINVTKP